VVQGRLLDHVSFEHPIDDYRVIWHGESARLCVIENTEGFSFGERCHNPNPPFIRITETMI
jgi:hypothetical protein